MRIAFFGTPEFAIPTLRALAASPHTLAVFTQPDRPVGRKAVLTPPPVKVAALELGLPVYQFEKIRSREGCDTIRAFHPDLYAVVAFGQLFSEENLSIPPLGAINVHGSLLPLYRGASPMQQSVMDGQTVVGVSTMMLVKRMDAGDVLMRAETPLGENETYGELSLRLSELGADLFMRTLGALERGELTPVPQDEAQATYCKMLTRDSGRIDLSAPRRTGTGIGLLDLLICRIYRFLRGQNLVVHGLDLGGVNGHVGAVFGDFFVGLAVDRPHARRDEEEPDRGGADEDARDDARDGHSPLRALKAAGRLLDLVRHVLVLVRLHIVAPPRQDRNAPLQ